MTRPERKLSTAKRLVRSRFEISPSATPRIVGALAVIFLLGFIASHLLFSWARQFDLVYPDFVRQKLFVYLRNICGVLLGVFVIIELLVMINPGVRRWIGKVLPELAVVLIALVLALAVAEGVARLIYKERYVVFELQGIHQPSDYPEILYELRPDASLTFFYKDQQEQIHYRINSLGLRGDEIKKRKPPGVIRILTIGDSVSFGVRIDQPEIYSRQLQNLLNDWAQKQNIAVRFEVLNPSACGWNTFNEVSWLEKRGISLQPDIVLLQFSMNDVDDPLVHMGTTVLYHLKKIPREFFPADPGKAGRENIFTKTYKDITPGEVLTLYGQKVSKLYAIALQVYQSVKMKRTKKKDGGARSLWLSWCLDILVNENAEQVKWLKRQFRRLKALCEAHNIAVAVVIFPLSYQLNSENAVYRDAIKYVKKYIKEARLDCFDLTPAFSSVSQTDQFFLYLPGDASHLNRTGHRFTARELFSFLQGYPPFLNLLKEKIRKQDSEQTLLK
ncbi:SGNH/GDSL hydrolase family protein [Candidatus Sumerlaeota bacterium]|nr:SGNH/GDSL hydrolase family protein [Candidatus Sumerlaeota bacterium]